jgi:lipopolysaccharide transport system permease protein
MHVYRPVKSRVQVRDVLMTFQVAKMIGLRDVRVKYKQAALGPLWLLIAPIGMLAAITVAFSGVTDVQTGGVPYLLFALTGLTVWTFVQLSLTLGAGAITLNAGLVRRSPLPRVALVTGAVLGNTPPIAIMFVITVVGTLLVRGLPLQALLIPIAVIWLVVFTLSLSLMLAAFAARFRDTVAMVPLILQAGIFVSPVGYSIKGAPQNIHTLLTLNPISGLIEAWRWSLLDIPDPQWSVVAVSAVWTVVLAFLGWRVFTRLEPDFADFV